MPQILLRADVQGVSAELDALISIKKIVPVAEEPDSVEDESEKAADAEDSDKKTMDDTILGMGAASVSYNEKTMREKLEYDPDDPYGE